MAIQTRYVGDSYGVVNVDNGSAITSGTGAIIATGLTKSPIIVKVLMTSSAGNIALETVTGGAVETILRSIELDSTITAYQVETSGTTTSNQISIMLEASGAGSAGSATTAGTNASASTVATALQTRLTSLLGAASGATGPTGSTTGGNIGIAGNIWAAGIGVTSSGFKLA